MNKWGVMFYFEKEGKTVHHYTECWDMISVARALITVNVPRGYHLVKVDIAEAEQLEMELFDIVRWNSV